jgi:MSHA biogenesis protein MshI
MHRIVRSSVLLALFKKKTAAKGITSVVFTEEGVAIAHVQDISHESELTFCEFVESKKPFLEPHRFSELIAKSSLQGSQALVVLPESCYQLHLVERPEVPDDELAEALRWRIKDMVTFDIDKTVVDYIELPEDSYRGRTRMVYAVVALREEVDNHVKWCQSIGLDPIIVDVPELALLNLTEDLADSEAGLAVFYLGERNSSINLLSDASLYFTRQLSYNKSASPESAGGAVLELQRSLDYYESQVGKPPCVRLMVMPLQSDDSPLMEELRKNLHLDIYSLNLNNLVTCNEHLSDELQQSVTIAAAAALRVADNTVEVK